MEDDTLRLGSAGVAAAIEAVAGSAAVRRNKEDLVAYIVDRVGDPEMHPSIPRKAADAVLLDDFDLAELELIVEATQRKRHAGELRGPARSYFRGRCIKAGMTRLAYAPRGSRAQEAAGQ